MADNLPYYPLVAPEVPVADHTAAKIIASGDLAGAFTRGFAGAAQAATARERARLESEQMITDAAMKSRELDIARENNVMDFQVGMKNASMVSDWNSDPNNPLGRAGRRRIAQEKMETWADFNKRAMSYGLLEANPKNPVQFYANKQKLHDEFAFAVDMSEVKAALDRFDKVAEQHSVPIKFGRTKNEDGEWTGGTETQKVPVGQIMEGMNDPDKREETYKLLESNGLITSTTEPRKVEGEFPYTSDWKRHDYIREWLFGPPKPVKKMVDQTVTEETVSPIISRYRAMASGVDFSRGKSRTPTTGVVVPNAGVEVTAPSITQDSVDEAAATMATESGAGVSTPPAVTATVPAKEALFPTTDTEKWLAQAKRAAAKPGANIAAIKAHLQSKGIDPNLL